MLAPPAPAQTQTPAPATGTPPSAGASCTASAQNRSAPLEITDGAYDFTIYNIPGAAAFIGPGTPPDPAPFRVRVVCSDGTVGETELAYPEFGSTAVYTGSIIWGRNTPIPVGINVTSAQARLTAAGQTTQLTTRGVLTSGEQVDLSGRQKGTLYTSSNPQIASVSDAGLVTVQPDFSGRTFARVVLTAQNEGVAGSTIIEIGGRGSIAGRIFRADGTTPVAGARVTVMSDQPRQAAGTLTTDSGGNYRLDDVGLGSYSLTVLDPATGDTGRGSGSVDANGETGTADVRLNGQGAVNVTVLDGGGAPVAGSAVTFTSLTQFRDVQTVQTSASGQAVFARALAGAFTVSTRDAASNLVGTASGLLAAGGSVNLTLKLQPVGAIGGTVFAADGSTPQAGVQVRVVSASRGLVSQAVTGDDGVFGFDGLLLADGPYTIDAMLDGRLRARAASLTLTTANQRLVQNLVFTPVGKVAGTVTNSGGTPVAGAVVTVQSQVGQHFAFKATTDAQGRYAVDGVAVGGFSITASTSTGETASGAGTIAADNAVVTQNLQLAANGIVGTVYDRDGTTPAGAGVSVALSNGGSVLSTTQTNAQGQYGFSVAQPGTYTVTAADGNGNKGVTSIALTAINPGDPKTVNVVFLGRGTVRGSVRDPGGNPQAGVPVTLTSSGVLGGTWTAVTDSQGNYRIDGVFVGDYSVYANNSGTHLAGLGRGRLAEDGTSVATDVALAATGAVNGRVFRQDGTTGAANAGIEYVVYGGAALKVSADANGNFAFPAVPLGDFTLVATDPGNGDKGQAVSRLVTANETRTLNVRLLGQGAVHIVAVDGNRQPVAGAAVTVTSASQFGGTLKAVTGADGTVTVGPVFNGDVSVTAEKGAGVARINASASGTIVNGATLEVPLTMASKPTGILQGLVTKGVGANPQAGITVQLAGLGNNDNRAATTGADGTWRFDLVEVGQTYRVTATVNGRVRARTDVTLSAADQTETRNLALLGVGTVSGVVKNAQAQLQAGAVITVTNADPTYGGTWTTTTQADGTYLLADIPAGNFVIRARSADNRLTAQDSGTVRFDADTPTVNLTLVDNAVSMPVNLYDANGARFDVQGDGTLASGTSNGSNGVFAGAGNSDAAAGRLEIVVNGVPAPFRNGDGSVGRLTQAGQLVEVDELNAASGLNVTRRIYVPQNGYFARNLEILENRTANPVTVGVRVTSNFAQGAVAAHVVDTSSGDADLDVSANDTRDRWLVVDDEQDADPFEVSNNPSVALVFDGAGASRSVASASVGAVGAAAKATWQWSDITIQPGESVALMHFTVQQLTRATARAAAERLSQLPPEALEGLTPEERAMVKNFSLPADGLSSVAPLPAIAGTTVDGTVLAGDGTTPIAGATVKLQSATPLYGRTYRLSADNAGRFHFASQRAGNYDVVAIPQDAFTLVATHPRTGAQTAPVSGAFANGTTAAQQDLVFSGTGVLKGNVRRHTGAVVTSGYAQIQYVYPGENSARTLQVGLDNSGAFQFIGIRPGSYQPTAYQNHPQGDAIYGSAAVPVVVNAGAVATADVTMEETGEVTGVVRAANNEPVAGAYVRLDDGYRSTQTDTGGNYRFTDVRTGGHAVTVSGANGLSANGNVTVSRDTASALNLQLAGTGQVSVQVNYARGAAAIGATVELNQPSYGTTSRSTDSAGRATFSARSDIALSVLAHHPDNYSLTAPGAVTITGNGSTAELTLTLPAAASVVGTVYRPDGRTPASGITVTLRRQDGVVYQTSATTNAAGAYRFNGLALAPYTVSAEDRENQKFADADRTLADDGQEATANLTLADNRLSLPADLRDANDFVFDVQPNGSIGGGWRTRYSSSYSVFTGGSQLEINGQAFAGDNSAALEAGKRQFVISQPSAIAGLNVRRKIFVPRGGYFARYLEILENPSGAPVTVGVKVRSKFRNNYGTAALVDTSSGDNALQTTGTARDTWAIVDDASDVDPFMSVSPPAVATVLGAGSPAVAHDSFALNTSSGTSLDVGWSSVTVPAQGRVILMHFEVQQVSRAGARASAQRLQQLPPEALASLGADEIAAIANFEMPADGVSAVEPLPSLLGSVSGVAYEGDHRTVVPNVSVQVRSTHPLFGRTWLPPYYGYCDWNGSAMAGLASSATGAFRLAGSVQDTASVPLPVGYDVKVDAVNATNQCYYGVLGHPVSNIPSRPALASFVDGASSATADVVFDSGVIAGTVAGPADFGVTSGTVSITLPANAIYNSTHTAQAAIGNGGAYTLAGIPAGSYPVTVAVPHGQGTGLIGAPASVTSTVGQTTATNLNVEPTGSLAGSVFTAANTAAVGAQVALQSVGAARSISRTTTVDSLGRYSLTAVPVGNYTLTVRDARTNAPVQSSITVGSGQAVTQNVTLLAVGTVRVNVRYASGLPAGGMVIYLNAQSIGNNVYQGTTDAQGNFNVAVPGGTYKISTYSPGDSSYESLWISATGTIASNGESQNLALTLKPHASLRVTAVDGDANNAPLQYASIFWWDPICANSCSSSLNGSGQYQISSLREGAYNIVIWTQDGRMASATGTVSTADDGQALSKTIVVTGAASKLGQLTFVGENQLYSVPANAGDVISVRVAGAQVNGGQSAYLTRVRVYQPNKSVLAQGYGYDSRNSYWQYNESGNLQNIVAPVAGNYPITVSPYYSDPQYLGGYRLQVLVNGVPVAPAPYADGGAVQGSVTRADGTPAPAQPLEVQSTDTLAMRVRIAADDQGGYSIPGVPLGGFKVLALEPQSKVTLVTASGEMTTPGATVTQNIALPKRTTLQVRVSIASPLPVPAQMNISVTDMGGTRQAGPVTFAAGATTSEPASVAVYGDSVTVSAVHPSNFSATASVTVQGADGQTVPVTLTLAFTGIQGTLTNSAGQPVGGAYVRAYVASSKRYLNALYTNGSGLYAFTSVPAGEEIVVQAQDPWTGTYTSARTTVQADQANVLDIRLAGTGTVSGRVTNAGGQPVSGATVYANYQYDEFNGYTTYVYAYSAADGRFTVQNVPAGRPVQLSATLSTNFGSISSTPAQLTLQAAGEAATSDILLTAPTGSVQLRLADTDGVPVTGSVCYYAALTAASGTTVSQWVCGSDTLFTSVPTGQATVTVNVGAVAVTGNVTAVDGQQVQAQLAAPVVKGVVRFADNSPVPNPSVSLVTDGGSTVYAYDTTAQGEFRIVGVPAGSFTLKAEHASSALRASAAGALASLDTPVAQDIALPPYATVSGVFRDRGNQPVANADVYVRSSAVDVDRYVRTDSAGAYSVPMVAQGNVTVYAKDPATGLIASGEGVLGAAGLAIDVTVPESTAVSGTVTNDGLPVVGAGVTLSTIRTYGPFGAATLTATADSAGRYAFAAAPLGDVKASVAFGAVVGIATGTTVAGTPSTLDVQVGGAVGLTYYLTGTDTSRYDVDCRGGLNDGGYNGAGDAYDGAYYLTVAGTSFPCTSTADLKTGTRELLLGPYAMSGMKVTRRVYVPAAGGYARYLETFVNPTANPVTVAVTVTANLGSDGGTRLIVAPAATGGRYAVTTDYGSDPALGHVFASAGADLVGTQVFTAPSDGVTYNWSVTVPAGGTVSLMHFAIQRNPSDSDAVTQQAESLSTMTQSGMFEGLSAADKANIKNFKVTP